MKIFTENRKARFEYEILETFTAGLMLEGWEAKSIRAGSVNLKSAWVSIRENSAYLENATIAAWKFSSEIQEKSRRRKLLLKKKELGKINREASVQRQTIIPLKIFASGSYLKCEIAIARGKKLYEKRETIKKRDLDRELRASIKF